jgi:hypothetical protein
VDKGRKYYPCPEASCKSPAFISIDELKDHYETHGSEGERFCCFKCGEWEKTREDIEQHYQSHHAAAETSDDEEDGDEGDGNGDGQDDETEGDINGQEGGGGDAAGGAQQEQEDGNQNENETHVPNGNMDEDSKSLSSLSEAELDYLFGAAVTRQPVTEEREQQPPPLAPMQIDSKLYPHAAALFADSEHEHKDELDPVRVAKSVRRFLERHQITQTAFARQVLNRPQSYLSKLLLHPVREATQPAKLVDFERMRSFMRSRERKEDLIRMIEKKRSRSRKASRKPIRYYTTCH